MAIDYANLIEELEAKRRQFIERTDAMIAHARMMMAMAQNADVFAAVPSSGPVAAVPSPSTEIPRTAFSGMKLQPAILAFLGAVQKKSTTTEIREGLVRGGLHSASKDLPANVYTALCRLENSGEVVRLDKEWGLAAWYPAYRPKRRENGSEKPPTRATGRAAEASMPDARHDAAAGPSDKTDSTNGS